MNRRIVPLIALLSFFTAGCATIPITLNPGAEAVKVGKSDATDNYEEIGPVTAVHGNGCGYLGTRGTYDGAVLLLKNKAHALGSNYVQIFTLKEPYGAQDCFVNEYVISGTAYRRTRESPSPLPIVEKGNNRSTSEKLTELQSLLSKKLISDQEYQRLRDEVLQHAYQ